MSSTYLSVAIPYVNSDPHIGYAYELVQADIHARAIRQAGDRVRFQGGTDDYSLKNVLAADQAGVPTAQFVSKKASRFEHLADPLNLSFDDFVRTSSNPRHKPSVDRLWRAVRDSGDLYQRQYSGEYCVGCEGFLGFDDLSDGKCPEHLTTPERVSETNWFFRLSKYQAYLDDLISTDVLQVRPEAFRQEALSFIRSGLTDISVSRSTRRARGWGIDVPDDPTQVVYVWFDALTNYVSGLGFGDLDSKEFQDWWLDADSRTHVIGKGILRFHAIYWPAFLASAGQPPPTRIQVHPYLSVGGAKISKSFGPAINPVEVVDAVGTDPLRWFFARDVSATADTDFTIERVIARSNDELANSIGNAVNRTLTLVHRYLASSVPEVEPIESVRCLVAESRQALLDFDLRHATALIVASASTLNSDITESEPWSVARGPRVGAELPKLLGRHVATSRAIAEALAPITPDLSESLRFQLGRGSELLPPNSPVLARIER